MKIVRDGWRAMALAALVAALSACEGGGGGPGPGPEPSVATTLAATTSTSQSAPVGTAVAEAPAVRVTDQRGAAMPGVSVTFAAAGGGTVANATATTDASGVASAGSWTLGAAAGANTVTASHGGLSPVQFAATGQPRVPAAVAAVSATTQAAVAATAVAEAPAVKVTDQTGALMQGVAVTFAVTAGGGTLATTSAVTNAQGVASAGSWTLGAAGQNTVTATVGTMAPVAFNAMSQARVATTITTVSATTQTAVAGTAVAQAPAVRVDDQTGTALPGVTVTFAVTAGGGTIATTSAVTNAQGIASAGTWTLGAAGQNTVTATVGQGTVSFNATAQPRVVTSITTASDTDQTAPAGTAVEAPRAVVRDQTGTPMAGVTVTFSVAGGGSVGNQTAATDPSGTASAASWTLGTTPGLNTVTAAAGTLSGVTFKATGVNPCDWFPTYTLGSTVDGAWTAVDCQAGNGTRRDQYYVQLTGAPAIFTLTSPTVDTYLVMYDLNNRAVATNNNDSGTNSAIRVIAPAGTYRIDAQAWATSSTMLGSYRLTSGGFDPENTDCKDFSIVPPVTRTTTLVPVDCGTRGYADIFPVILLAGETLTLRMESDAFQPFLILVNGAGNIVAQRIAQGGAATLTYTATASDRYRIYADYWDPGSAGEYTITVTRQ